MVDISQLITLYRKVISIVGTNKIKTEYHQHIAFFKGCGVALSAILAVSCEFLVPTTGLAILMGIISLGITLPLSNKVGIFFWKRKTKKFLESDEYLNLRAVYNDDLRAEIDTIKMLELSPSETKKLTKQCYETYLKKISQLQEANQQKLLIDNK